MSLNAAMRKKEKEESRRARGGRTGGVRQQSYGSRHTSKRWGERVVIEFSMATPHTTCTGCNRPASGRVSVGEVVRQLTPPTTVDGTSPSIIDGSLQNVGTRKP
jgi:hypothetical protein